MALSHDPFAQRLLAGERIVWSGRPAGGLLFTAMDLFLVPFSFVWIAFAVVWTSAAMNSGGGPFFVAWGLMFVVVGATVMLGRFALDAWLRERTRYALTTHRLLIARSEPFGDFSALFLERLPEARLSERADGRGTISFGQRNLFAGGGFGFWVPGLDSVPRLVAVPDARHVFDLIQGSAVQRDAWQE